MAFRGDNNLLVSNLSNSELIYFLCNAYSEKNKYDLGTEDYKKYDEQFNRAYKEVKERMELTQWQK